MRITELKQAEPDAQQALIALWDAAGLLRPWNDPVKDIERALTSAAGAILLGYGDNGELIASAMFGYDGHRGNVYYLAVDPKVQGKGFGKQILIAVEEALLALDCPKVSLMVRETNLDVIAFYEAAGYRDNEVRSLGKRLIPDDA